MRIKTGDQVVLDPQVLSWGYLKEVSDTHIVRGLTDDGYLVSGLSFRNVKHDGLWIVPSNAIVGIVTDDGYIKPSKVKYTLVAIVGTLLIIAMTIILPAIILYGGNID